METQERTALAEDLNEFICNKKVLEVFSSEILFVIIKKMVLHEDNKIKANNLEKVFTVLMTIQPNSVESDRAFSGLGCFVCKVRNRRQEETFDSFLL